LLPARTAETDYRQALQTIAREIEAMKPEFPQLADFSAAKALDPDADQIAYQFHTHRASHNGGWTSGVPNPDADGIWFYIDFHAPASESQYTVPPWVSMRQLEGSFSEKTRTPSLSPLPVSIRA
ncbi:MAG: hypothetical protein HGB21_15170, partial [Nitrospirae bacterium]|nr:hypothetical protein [Nitrospirota bacterium]